jgi:hypothetical protein
MKTKFINLMLIAIVAFSTAFTSNEKENVEQVQFVVDVPEVDGGVFDEMDAYAKLELTKQITATRANTEFIETMLSVMFTEPTPCPGGCSSVGGSAEDCWSTYWKWCGSDLCQICVLPTGQGGAFHCKIFCAMV